MNRQEKWDVRFMDMATIARGWVKGPDLGVGACAVSPSRQLFSLGYSGLPRGIEDNEERITSHFFKDHNLVHAELNAILNAGRDLSYWTMYSTACPCARCASAIIQSGIKRLVSPPPNPDSRWHDSQCQGAHTLREAGVEITRCRESSAIEAAAIGTDYPQENV